VSNRRTRPLGSGKSYITKIKLIAKKIGGLRADLPIENVKEAIETKTSNIVACKVLNFADLV
jgi:hypothetical protein